MSKHELMTRYWHRYIWWENSNHAICVGVAMPVAILLFIIGIVQATPFLMNTAWAPLLVIGYIFGVTILTGYAVFEIFQLLLVRRLRRAVILMNDWDFMYRLDGAETEFPYAHRERMLKLRGVMQ